MGFAHHRLVPFSCKTRGFCPSCAGRRMAEGAAVAPDHLVACHLYDGRTEPVGIGG